MSFAFWMVQEFGASMLVPQTRCIAFDSLLILVHSRAVDVIFRVNHSLESEFDSAKTIPMIDVKDLRENPDKYRRGAELKRIPADIDAALELDSRRNRAQQEHDKLRAEQNEASKNIGKIKDPEERKRVIAAMGELKSRVEQAKKVYG
jgi:hypothetical protein